MNPTRVVLCEGYEDRAFLKGWLHHRGWRDHDHKHGPDAVGTATGGVFRFLRGGVVLRVQPVQGSGNLASKAREILQLAKTKRHLGFDFLAVCFDPDDAPGTSFSHLPTEAPDGFRVRTIPWRCDSCSDGFPAELQNLERVVCAALAEGNAPRAIAVRDWLSGGPELKPHKQHARSWHARWYADRGCEAFFESLWPEYAAAFEARLPTAVAVLEELECPPEPD